MNKKLKINLLSIFTIIFWSIAFPLSKVAMQHYSPFTLGFLRVCIASVTLSVICKLTGGGLPKKKGLVLFLISGACGFGIYLFVFNKGMQTLTSASSSIVIAITPVLTAIIANYVYDEKLNIIGWITIFTAFFGVATMMLWDGVFSINKGILWTLLASIVFSIYNVLNRKLSKMGYKPIEIVTYSMISSAFILSPFSVQGIKDIISASSYDIIVLIILGVFSSALAYFLWSNALSLTDNTSDVTNYSFLTPFVATIMGSLILGEIPGLGTLVGGLIIISSITIFSIRGKLK